MDNKITRKITQDNFTTEKIDVIENTLLGDYDDNGHYFIAPQIINELLELKKHRKSSFGNSMFCIGRLLGYGEIVFELAFNKKTKVGEQALAKLYVLENVDKINGYLQNTIKTKIAEFSSDVDNFIEVAFNHFKITNTEVDDEGKERKLIDDLNNEESFILAKKQYSLLLEKLTEEKFLDAYGKYFTFRISALTKLDNEFAKAVLDAFNEEYALIENVFLENKNYKVLNELLDKCIESVSGLNPTFVEQEKDFNEKTAPALETFIASVDRLNEKFGHKALNMLDKDDREKVEEIHEAENNSLDQTELNTDNTDNGDSDGEKIIDNDTIEEVSSELPKTVSEDIPVIPTISEEQEEKETEEQSEEKTSPKEKEQSNSEEQPQESQTFKDIRDYFEREHDTKIEETSETTTETKETIGRGKSSREETSINDTKTTSTGVRVFDEKAKAEIPSYKMEGEKVTDVPNADKGKPVTKETIENPVVTSKKEKTPIERRDETTPKTPVKIEREEKPRESYNISKRVVIKPTKEENVEENERPNSDVGGQTSNNILNGLNKLQQDLRETLLFNKPQNLTHASEQTSTYIETDDSNKEVTDNILKIETDEETIDASEPFMGVENNVPPSSPRHLQKGDKDNSLGRVFNATALQQDGDLAEQTDKSKPWLGKDGENSYGVPIIRKDKNYGDMERNL